MIRSFIEHHSIYFLFLYGSVRAAVADPDHLTLAYFMSGMFVVMIVLWAIGVAFDIRKAYWKERKAIEEERGRQLRLANPFPTRQ
jgi:hypothetical protein